MSTTSHGPTSSRPGDGPSDPLRSRSTMNAGGLITLAIVVLVIGLPLALVLTTIVTLTVLAWSPSYQSRTTDGRVIGTLFKPCTGDTWRITDTGAARS